MIQINKIAGVLWDMDGVLVDTREYHFNSLVTALDAFEIHFSREIFNQTYGSNISNFLNKTLGYPPSEQLVQNLIKLQGDEFCKLLQGQLGPIPGVIDTLNYFQGLGFRQAIASSSDSSIIDAILEEVGIRPFFHSIISGAYLPPKPNPDIFLQAATAIHVLTPSCLVIEDSPAGIEGARSAGMVSLAITNSHPRSKLNKADMVVDSLFDFLTLNNANNP
jgi:beta-phosphoglucomutase